MYKLQDVYLMPVKGNEQTKGMYYRGSDSLELITLFDGTSEMRAGEYLETFTYYNSLSVEKWSKYTYSQNYFLNLEIKGSFELTLFGHYVENKEIKKEYLGKFKYDCSEMTKLTIPYPLSFRSQIVAFSINAFSTLNIKNVFYFTDIDSKVCNKPYISLVTTTYKKETFIRKNIQLLKKELFENDEFVNGFCWHIVDNGRTLSERNDNHISIIHNSNVGGAGGFAKGMIDSLMQKKKPTHILFMDDDVMVSAESFIRTFRLLSIIRPEYKDYFISGAMLNMDNPNIQHECTGTLEDGFCKPLNSGRDLNCWDQILLNEQLNDHIHFQYAAWWYCCIPVGVARVDNLPLPLFVRGDDMEYSIRNHARFITMNGIGIWHMGFGGKYNAAMECYQAKRNELIVFSIRKELDIMSSFNKIEELFWQNIYRFDYVSAGFLIDAVEDYLKGPEWLLSTDLFEEINKRREEDNKKENIPPNINIDDLFSCGSSSKLMKFIYDYTYNGQARIPSCISNNRTGVFPYNGGYYPNKHLLTSVNYAIDTYNDKCVVFKRDKKQFSVLKNRWNCIYEEFLKRKDEVEERYLQFEGRMTNVSFWNDYLVR